MKSLTEELNALDQALDAKRISRKVYKKRKEALQQRHNKPEIQARTPRSYKNNARRSKKHKAFRRTPAFVR